ncbi:hypothetical protein KFK09_001390 [Dendrobium nobile]|uniref:Uncharacterized protein n=1 Tax=Dendrobium nobile TaxID=94219 RepID=A0A8T3C753_DENNO|nr:hypothetical protein KFK09_001390 [Dendrobium nobile]
MTRPIILPEKSPYSLSKKPYLIEFSTHLRSPIDCHLRRETLAQDLRKSGEEKFLPRFTPCPIRWPSFYRRFGALKLEGD